MATSNKMNYPTELRLPNGEVLKVAESSELKTFLDQTIATASQTEKDKLYATIEAEKKKAEEARTEVTTLNRQSKEWAELIAAQEKKHEQQQQLLRKQLDDAAASANSNPERLRDMMASVFDEQLKPLREALTTNEQRTAELERTRVFTYLQNKLVELGDTVIPDLVQGNTIEEIDASIVNAMEMRKRYAPVVQNAPVAPVTEPVAPVVAPVAPVAAPVSMPLPNGDVSNKAVIPPHSTPNPLLPPQPETVQVPAASAAPVASPQPAAQPVVVPYVGTFQNPPSTTSMPNISGMSEKEFASSRESLLAQLKGNFMPGNS